MKMEKKNRKRIIAFVLAVVCFGIILLQGMQTDVLVVEAVEETKTAQQVVDEMGVGWNLGNTLESSDGKRITTEQLNGKTAELYYETLWENPKTSAAMIQKVKQAGFGAVRVPVSYGDHMSTDGTIDVAWLNRVKEVVGYVMDADLYCIINLHWEGWLVADADEAMVAKYQYVWQQIAGHFSDVGDKLLFASMNEVRNRKNLYDSVGADSLAVINQLNQTFVSTVRAAGGENAGRYLVVVPYTAYTLPKILDAFVLPEDTIADHLIAEVHTYANAGGIDWVFTCIDKYLVKRNIPVILGEFGQRAENYTTQQRIEYLKYVLAKTDALGIAPFWWDTGGRASTPEGVKAYALLNRNTLEWYFPEIVNVITEHER